MNVIQIPQILLPKDVDMNKWAVNACDQFTSDEAYWQGVRDVIGEAKSTYRLVYPEIYLKDRPDERIAAINQTMNDYLADGVFQTCPHMILVERTTESGIRTGIVLAIDLEAYSFQAGTKALIRSTEATILERIPPRVAIRKNAPIELPHIMLLYQDKHDAVLSAVQKGKTLYDFDLMQGGGHLKGTAIENDEEVIDAFYREALVSQGADDRLLFAVGDGNHSLATAKTCWEAIKPTLTEEERQTHPARFCLCEVVNLYSQALRFEPIHRLVKTKHVKELLCLLQFSGEGRAEVVSSEGRHSIDFPLDTPNGIRQLDAIISRFLSEYEGEVDYIHGEEEILSLSREGVGILLPAIPKDDFFRLIMTGGNLPRKTFSMGEGNEKRYYVEAKKIR